MKSDQFSVSGLKLYAIHRTIAVKVRGKITNQVFAAMSAAVAAHDMDDRASVIVATFEEVCRLLKFDLFAWLRNHNWIRLVGQGYLQ